jgi:hypothetical protein
MKSIVILVTTIAGLLIALSGCDGPNEHARVAQVATEAAERQAEQNRVIAHQNQELAGATKELVAADAKARQEMATLHHDLQGEQAKVDQGRDQLEGDRRAIAAQRNRDPIVAVALESLGLILACLLPLAICLVLLFGLRRESQAQDDQALAELLIEDVMAERPKVLVLPPESPFRGLSSEKTPLLDVSGQEPL